MTDFLSDNSLISAFEKVNRNQGCAGVDRVTITQFKTNLFPNLETLRNEVLNKTYIPLPLMKILVDKGDGDPRALCVPSVRDRILQTAVLKKINPVFEKEFEDSSFAYRKGRSVLQVVSIIQKLYDQGFRWVVDGILMPFSTASIIGF